MVANPTALTTHVMCSSTAMLILDNIQEKVRGEQLCVHDAVDTTTSWPISSNYLLPAWKFKKRFFLIRSCFHATPTFLNLKYHFSYSHLFSLYPVRGWIKISNRGETSPCKWTKLGDLKSSLCSITWLTNPPHPIIKRLYHYLIFKLFCTYSQWCWASRVKRYRDNWCGWGQWIIQQRAIAT